MDILLNVKNQTITRGDANAVVADSKNYLKARFVFTTDEWDSVTKTAVFQKDNKVYNAVLTNNECLVPHEVLSPGLFTISVFGGNLITTGTVQVRVGASGYCLGSESTTPAPDVYAQITEQLATLTNSIAALTARVEALEEATEEEVTTNED